jgi:phosphinothricin acetyltransferase
MNDATIRRAEPADLPALLAIYNHHVLTTPATFDVAPRTLEQRREWFAQFSDRGRYRCFAAARDGRAVGWCCSTRFKEKEAYATTIETSIYLAPGEGGRGLGKRLYLTLFDALVGEDIHRAFAGVTLPNDASVALHRALDFEEVGRYPQIGRKFGHYWDVGLFVKDVGGA